MDALNQRLKYYKSQHRTLGCKITHLVGVPLIAISLPLMLFSNRRWPQRRNGLRLFTAGWLLQFIGHYLFEKNRPALFTEADPLIVLAALIYVGDGWKRVLTGRPLLPEEDRLSKEQAAKQPRQPEFTQSDADDQWNDQWRSESA